MLSPGHARLWDYFYPFGNTAAVCLTQALPPEKKADMLLLGCGDVRNILFTSTVGYWSSHALAARNILLVTLIVDDPDGERDDNWDIYYHVFLNDSCYDRLIGQATKLHSLCSSLETWRASKYGKLIRFCDHGTLTRVAQVWAFYIFVAPHRQSWINTTFKDAVDTRKGKVAGISYVIPGVRNATPTGVKAAVHIYELHEHFWRHGSLHLDSTARSQATFANPMFVSSLHETMDLHQGLDPLLGFHTSTAYVPLAADPASTPEETGSEDVVVAAKAEFRAWSNTFRTRAEEYLTLRFFAGDALSFCHTLQHRRVTGSATTASWYRSRHHTMDPLVLVDDDYGTDGTAPVSFDVVDTSDLADCLGILNLLVATSPLLDNDASSCLYTDILARHGEATHQGTFSELVGGHAATVSLLLGLFPMEYWTNTASSSIGDDHLLLVGADQWKSEATSNPQFLRITWRRPPSTPGLGIEPLHVNEISLSLILYKIYADMFLGEDVTTSSENSTLPGAERTSLSFYTRAGFVSLLSLVKRRVVTDWDQAMQALLAKVESNSIVMVGMNFMQELFLYMHLLDVYSVGTFKYFDDFRVSMSLEPKRCSGLLGWQNLPPCVCITLKVPRLALREFTSPNPRQLGSIAVQAAVQSFPKSPTAWFNAFAAVQLCFGTLSTSGTPFSNSFELSVKENLLGWLGECPLYVSFRVPSWIILREPQTAIVSFGPQRNPFTADRSAPTLGPELVMFEKPLGDTTHVYISKHPPNLRGFIKVPGFAKDVFTPQILTGAEAKTSITASVNSATAWIDNLTARLELSGALRAAVAHRKSAIVTLLPPSHCEVRVDHTVLDVTFPLPTGDLTAYIEPAGHLIELSGPIINNPATSPTSAFTSPLIFPPFSTTLHHGPVIPICWTAPYITLSKCPKLSTANPVALSRLSFLRPHIDMMFSARETRMGKSSALQPLMFATEEERGRLKFKLSLARLFSEVAGFAVIRPSSWTPRRDNGGDLKFDGVYTLRDGSGSRLVIFVESFRLDLARRTVVLDCAVLVFTLAVLPALSEWLRPQATDADSTGGGAVIADVDAEEMRVWKETLPSWVERCREWMHREGCEYGREGKWKAPVGRLDDPCGEVVCGCGRGVFPAGWKLDSQLWNAAKEHCVRAAISPLFASALAEDTGELGEKAETEGVIGCRACGKKMTKEGGELKDCNKCLKVKYCGRACQRADLKRHKPECGASKE
ncbi:hypothetical protein N658DRAFT_475678 [Parathielavia hyrcaniae]|uniref:MYND-type domain-containing protein n=1 Tax=Parathielavia hyrcaniae TaxID=113614 RepID=A0AAN6T080_9PEZI|nr:hypothetical protein N658DRAFT_475678 [Parathielavia hyrcaniae]